MRRRDFFKLLALPPVIDKCNMPLFPHIGSSSGVGTVLSYPTNGLEAAFIINADEQALIPELGDDSGNQLLLTNTGLVPTFSETAVASNKAGAVFSAGQDLGGAVASDWSFLHSDELTVVLHVHPTSALGGQSLLRTISSGTPTSPGVYMTYQGGIGTARFQFLQYGTGGALVLNINGTFDEAPTNNPYVVIWRVSGSGVLGVNDSTILLNGSTHATADYTGSIDAGAPATSINIGKAVTGNHYYGALASCLLYSRCLTDAEISAQITPIIPTLRSARVPRVLRLVGDSITVGAQTYRRKLQMRFYKTTALRCETVGAFSGATNAPAHDPDHDGVNGQLINQMTSRIAGYTGEEPTDVINVAGTNNISTQTVSEMVAELRLLIQAEKTRHPGARIWVFEIPYGDGGSFEYTSAGKAGGYNTQLPTVCSEEGAYLIKIHGDATYPWVPATHASDAIGHPTPAGGDIMGNNAAVTMNALFPGVFPELTGD